MKPAAVGFICFLTHYSGQKNLKIMMFQIEHMVRDIIRCDIGLTVFAFSFILIKK